MFLPRRDGWEVLDALCILMTPDSCQTDISVSVSLSPTGEGTVSLIRVLTLCWMATALRLLEHHSF